MPKTEVLSMRITPLTRFHIEWISRNRGQNVSTVVSLAIEAAAAKLLEKDEADDLLNR
jgi:hypothetical protein